MLRVRELGRCLYKSTMDLPEDVMDTECCKAGESARRQPHDEFNNGLTEIRWLFLCREILGGGLRGGKDLDYAVDLSHVQDAFDHAPDGCEPQGAAGF